MIHRSPCNSCTSAARKVLLFSLTSSPLLQNLMAGNPVILTNLEQNPRFAARIETLLLPSPYLFVHGHKIDLPRVNLTVLSGETGSPLIDQLSSAPDKSSQNPLYRLLLALPASFQKRYPATLPWAEDKFNRLFEQQSDAQRRFDGSPVYCYPATSVRLCTYCWPKLTGEMPGCMATLRPK